jgi:hypothetical protein
MIKNHLDYLDYLDYFDYLVYLVSFVFYNFTAFRINSWNQAKERRHLRHRLCSRINSWNRAKERRYLRHRLCSRVKDDQPQGYAAFDWETVLHGNAGELCNYKERAVLPDKIARYLYDFNADTYASLGLPPLPLDGNNIDVHGNLKTRQVIASSSLRSLRYLDYVFYIQNRALPDTLRKLHTSGRAGHIAVFNTLAMGHTKHSGEQGISSFPFAVKKLTRRASNRQGFVFIRPPGISHGTFQLRMDNVWFCKLLLLFEIE